MQTLQLLLPQQQPWKILWANRYFLRLRGLIGRHLAPQQGLLLEPCNQVHCCGMQFAIDVVYLNAGNQVLAITENMQPGTFGKRVHGAKKVLELPALTAAHSGIQPGIVLSLHKEGEVR